MLHNETPLCHEKGCPEHGDRYEGQFLALCETHEELRRECPNQGSRYHRPGWAPNCFLCLGRGWLPLPEAERVGALVEVCEGATLEKVGDQWYACTDVPLGWPVKGPAPKAWQALTAALTQAQEAA